jgi:tetratricopeptide (TPR) repeat protein
VPLTDCPARCIAESIARALRWLYVALGLSIAASAATAQMFKEPALEALYLAEGYGELERIGRQRIAAAPGDGQAVLAVAMNAVRHNDGARRRASVAAAEACLERAPQAAACHYALGAVLTAQALGEGGALKIAMSIGRVRAAMGAAVELEPAWFPPRSGLVEFYLQAPALAGGSRQKAREVARAAPRPEQQRALDARIAWHEKQYDAALVSLRSLEREADRALAREVQTWIVLLGFDMLRAGQVDQAKALFERIVAERPGDAHGPFGLARVAARNGAHAQALELFAASEKLRGAAELPIAYRAGISMQELGQLDAARESYRRFIAANRGVKRNLDDARRRLEALGS